MGFGFGISFEELYRRDGLIKLDAVFVRELQTGNVELHNRLMAVRADRSQLTAFCDAYFTQEAMEDFASSLKPLGTPTSFRQVSEGKRGGMTFRAFNVVFPGRQVRVTVYEMPDGKLEQYLVEPSGS